MLKPQDVLVACKLLALGEKEDWTFSRLAGSLSISVSETHAASERCKRAGVLILSKRKLVISKRKIYDLLTLAVPQVFYAIRGAIVPGIPTSVWAKPLESRFPQDEESIVPLVWPDPDSPVRGETLLPLYPTVTRAIRHDPLLHEILSLVDVLRTGGPDERARGESLLKSLVWDRDRPLVPVRQGF